MTRRAYHEWPNGDAGDAVDFALDHIEDPFERTDFLECWRSTGPDWDGGLSEWPEYYRWLKVQHEGSLAAKGTEAGTATTTEIGVVHDGPVVGDDLPKEDHLTRDVGV